MKGRTMLNQPDRSCDRCGRPQRDIYESPAGDRRCLFCLRFVGLRAEADLVGPLPGRRLMQGDEAHIPTTERPESNQGEAS
jgi:hypothetical protein